MTKRRIVSALILICVLLEAMTLLSCNKNRLKKYTAYSLDSFDTVTTVVGYEKSKEDFDAVSKKIFSELSRYHELFTIYQRYEGVENLCTINELQNGVHRTVKVDKAIIDMLLYAKEMHTKTGGAMNIAMGSVLSIWHDYRTNGIDDPGAAELPSMQELEEAAKHTDINNLVIDEENSTVTITDPKMTLDVGAVAKGYAVEMIARNLEAEGVCGYVLNVGGNIRTIGRKGNGEFWTVGIENPSDDPQNPYLEYLELAGEALVTSGSYQRFYVVDGKSYHHIIDQKTLMPAEGYQLVSVVCENSAEGDALSTALFCMTLDEGRDFLKSFPNVEVMWVMSDGTMYKTDGFNDYVKK